MEIKLIISSIFYLLIFCYLRIKVIRFSIKMKKKLIREEKTKELQTAIKSKRSKLGDLTNFTPESHITKKPQSQSKSVKSMKKSAFKTLQASKQCRENTASNRVSHPRYGSSGDNTRSVEPFAETIPNEIIILENISVESILKVKLSTAEEQNKYLTQINKQLKMQLGKYQEQILELNKSQGNLRDENKESIRKFEKEEEKWAQKENEYKSKIKALNSKVSSLIEQKQLLESKTINDAKEEADKYAQLMSKFNLQKIELQKQIKELQTDSDKRNSDNLRHIEQLKLKIQQFSQKFEANSQIHTLFVQNLKSSFQLIQIQGKTLVVNQSKQNIFIALEIVKQQLSRLIKLNADLNFNLEQTGNLNIKYSKQIEALNQAKALNQIQQQQISRLNLLIKDSKNNQLQSMMISTNQKMQQTKTSLEYWKKKFDECKLENIKLKKETEIQQEEIKVTLTSLKRLQCEVEKKANEEQLKNQSMNHQLSKDQNIKIEELKKQNQLLKDQKIQMEQQRTVMKEKLHIFREKVIILQNKLRQMNVLRAVQPQQVTVKRLVDNSFTLNQSGISKNQSESYVSRYYVSNNHLNSHTTKSQQKHNSFNLMAYKGETQAKLEAQFRSNKFVCLSPQKPVYLSSVLKQQ